MNYAWGTSLVSVTTGKVLDVELAENEEDAQEDLAVLIRANPGSVGWVRPHLVRIEVIEEED